MCIRDRVSTQSTGTMEHRYYSRLGAFQHIFQPTFPSWESVSKQVNPNGKEPEALYNLAFQNFTEAQKNLQKVIRHDSNPPEYVVADARKLAKIILTNIVYLNSTVQGLKNGTIKKRENQKRKIVYDFSQLATYPVMSLVEK
eukprot:TRINITY_DN7015_c0_g1_i3.p1 TRINITY_DN7015_c0_g1~~TRINITY_DN7015_c0_g1_i3.p1  ORF type:complete len:142 (+),score=17.86 TRINITY_DN7015_c0_g1_i3:43-468(+)